MFVRQTLLSASLSLFAASVARADLVATYEVGSGAHQSSLQFDFANGDSHLYLVRWDGSVTGRDLFDIVDSAQGDFFSFATVVFPFGEALHSVGIGGDFDAGFGTPPEYLDYWHYWTRDSASDPWGYADAGFAERVVADGSWDGWVFGSNGPPAAVPAAGGAGLAFLASGRSRRRRA